MRNGKILALAGAAALILTLAACTPSGEEPGSVQESSPVSTAAETQDLTAEEREELKELALYYERYNIGCTLAEGEPEEAGILTGLGLLLKNGMLEPYERPDGGWSVPGSLIDAANSLIFDTEGDASEPGSTYRYSSYLSDLSLPFELTEESAESPEPGVWDVTYQRQSEKGILTPVTYRFARYELQEVPPDFEGIYQPGDTLYRIVSVTQRADLLPPQDSRVIEIATAEDLLAAAERINKGGYLTQNDTYLLTEDIDLEGVEWTPMGDTRQVQAFWPDPDSEWDPSRQGFNGIFDGQGHTIRNLTITEDRHNSGLFSWIGVNGTVRNLNLENARVLSEPESGKSCIGLLAGRCDGTVERVSVQGAVSGGGTVGGLVGKLVGYDAVGTVKNCSAQVEVTGCSHIGGLVGMSHDGTVTDSSASGRVNSVSTGRGMPSNIGGFAGHSAGGSFIRCDAEVYVLTQAESKCVGSFCGLAEDGSFRECSIDGQFGGNWEPVDDYYRLDPSEPDIEVK